MPRSLVREIDCEVVKERIQAQLRDKRSSFSQVHKQYFVQCNQQDCQYAGENKPPCPLSPALFAEEIAARDEELRKRKENAG
jgi:hypothetical protein